MARSRSPFFVRTSGAFRSACACWRDSQFPTRGRGLCDQTYYMWRSRLARERPPRFALVKTKAAPAVSRAPEPALELIFATGERLRIHNGADAAELSRAKGVCPRGAVCRFDGRICSNGGGAGAATGRPRRRRGKARRVPAIYAPHGFAGCAGSRKGALRDQLRSCHAADLRGDLAKNGPNLLRAEATMRLIPSP